MKRYTICLLLVLLLAACGSAPDKPAEHANPPAQGDAAQQPGTEKATPSKNPAEGQQPLKNIKVAVYYTDDQLSEIIKEEQEIRYSDDLDKYKQAIALLEHPSDKKHAALWQGFAYHSVTCKDGTVTIDSKGTNIYNVGATGEILALEALKETLYQFPEVKQIVILEDGQPLESLAGHVILDEALKK